MREDELDSLLAELRKQAPCPAQVSGWKASVREAAIRGSRPHFWARPSFRTYAPVAAALALGFLAGAIFFHSPQAAIDKEIFASTATFERTHDNLD